MENSPEAALAGLAFFSELLNIDSVHREWSHSRPSKAIFSSRSIPKKFDRLILQHPCGLGGVRRDSVHQRRRQTVIRLQAKFAEAAADSTLVSRVGARLDNRRDEGREPRPRPAWVRRQLRMNKIEPRKDAWCSRSGRTCVRRSLCIGGAGWARSDRLSQACRHSAQQSACRVEPRRPSKITPLPASSTSCNRKRDYKRTVTRR